MGEECLVSENMHDENYDQGSIVFSHYLDTSKRVLGALEDASFNHLREQLQSNGNYQQGTMNFLVTHQQRLKGYIYYN